jgi:hypothetical protein
MKIVNKQTHHYYVINREYPDTAVRVRGVLRYAKVRDRTRTRGTHFGSTAGKPVPVRKPIQAHHHS